jgi:LPS-assembly protein
MTVILTSGQSERPVIRRINQSYPSYPDWLRFLFLLSLLLICPEKARRVKCNPGKFTLAILGILTICQWVIAPPAAAQAQINTRQTQSVIKDPKIPWQLEADEIFYDQKYDAYVAKGNVLIYKANIKIVADFIRFSQKDMKAYAEGNVLLTNGEDILSGTSMDIDLENQIGEVEDGYLFIKENNYHLTGNPIKKVGEKTYTIAEATLTTCDGDNPDWKITGKNVKVTSEGGGTATHATMWARKMPVLYTPYFHYPARKNRQTGLLWPQYGHSDRWGWYYNQPFFWAIDKSSDATFYAHYLDKRGLKGGIEYRYYLDDWSKGTWMFDGFDDKQVDSGGESSENWGFEDGNSVILRRNTSRYWFRGSHQQKMPYGIRGQLDLDLVSDQDYTREFKKGYMGWNNSKEYFEDVFARDLDDYNDPIRTNRLNFQKLWPQYSLNFEFRYDLDSTIRNSKEPDETLQQLPLINFDAIKQRISNSPFFYTLDSQYLYFWSKDGERTQRVDAFPRIYLPLRFKSFFSIEPSVGLRGTLWYLDKKEYGPDGDKKFYDRGLYDTRVDLFSEIFKVFRIEGQTIEAIKHTLRPRIAHSYIPDVDQEDLPKFDAIDRIDNQNLLTYSLTNTLTSKTRKEGSFEISRQVGNDQATVIDSATDYSYNDFLRFELEQSYDIKEAKQKDSVRPFSPVAARLDLFPGKYIGLDADALWSVYDYKFLSHNIGGKLWDKRGDRLEIEYRYTRDSEEISLNEVKSFYGELSLKVTDRIRVSGLYEYNFLDDTRVQTGFGLDYRADCWSFEGSVVDKVNVGNQNDLNWEFNIKLFGLGEFGI